MGYVMFLICPVTDISALKVYMLEYEMFRIIKIVKKKTNKQTTSCKRSCINEVACHVSLGRRRRICN